MKREYVALFSAISTSGKLADLSCDSHRLFFTWLLAQADAWGRIEADPRVTLAKVWPMLGKTCEQTEAAIEDCCRVGLLEIHAIDGLRWIQVPDWDQKAGKIGQLIRDRGESKFPRPTPGSVQDKPSQIRVDQIRSDQSRVVVAGSDHAEKKNGHVAKRAIPDTDHARFIEWWHGAFLRATGNEYAFEGGKDGQAVHRVLKTYAKGDLDLAKARAQALLDSQDPFYADKGVNLSTLSSCWNKLASAGRQSRGAPTFESAFEANVRDMQMRLAKDGVMNGHVQPLKEIAQ